MAEIISDVFDAVQPSPPTLKELSAIAISLEIFRSEIDEKRRNRTLESFYLSDLYFCLLEYMYPDLPPAICRIIKGYVDRFTSSMDKWLNDHYNKVFHFHYSHENYVLEDFDDFVCHYDGTIDYVKTAERMMRCDRFGKAKKFRIACTYFFEEEIRRIWPSVSRKIGLTNVEFNKSPQLFYWICYLTNQLQEIPRQIPELFDENDSVDEIMFAHHMFYNRPSVEYFWNRIPLERRMTKAIDLYINLYLCRNVYIESFAILIFPKFDHHQLEEFVNTRGAYFMQTLLKDHYCHEWSILRTWMRIRNVMNEQVFTNLVVEILQAERISLVDEDMESYRCWYLYCEIWNSAPNNLRRSALAHILRNDGLFENVYPDDDDELDLQLYPKSVDFQLTILSDATIEERGELWYNCWCTSIASAQGQNFRQLMNLYLRKKNHLDIVTENENLREFFVSLLADANFKKLNRLVDLCHHETPHAARKFKQELLRSSLLGQSCCFGIPMINDVEKLSAFIDDIMDNADLAAQFKNQLLLSAGIQHRLLHCIRRKCFAQIMEFIDTFASTEQTVEEMKSRVFDFLRECLTEFEYLRVELSLFGSCFDEFLLWGLGSYEEVFNFKLSCDLL